MRALDVPAVSLRVTLLAGGLVLALLLSAVPLHARGGPVRPPRKNPRDGFDFGDQGPKPAPERPGARDDRDRTPDPATPADPIQAEILRLRRWPANRAKTAAESLYLRGDAAIPYLVRALDGTDPSIQPGAAVVLGQLGQKVHIQTILRAAARRENGSRAETFFKAAWNIDEKTTKNWLIGFLPMSNRPTFRSLAARFLASRVNSEDRNRVLSLLEARKASVRAAALELLEPAGVEDAEARLLAALGDLSPEVCQRAALLLGLRMDEPTAKQVNELAREGDARERAYATLAMAEAIRATRPNPFEPKTLLEISGRRGLLHPDKLNRASAAVGLAYGALDAPDTALGSLLDSTVVDVLVDAIGGSHFRDFAAFQEPIFAALKRLSGRVDLADTAVAWAGWWRDQRGSFRARRPLRTVSAATLPRATVAYEATAADGRQTAAQFVSADGVRRAGAFLLTPDAFAALVKALEHAGIFEGRDAHDPRQDEHLAVTLRVADQRRRLVLTPADKRAYPQLKMRLQSLTEANIWQRYRDKDRNRDAKAWWQTNAPLMAEASPEERDLLLQAAIVYAYDDLPDEAARREAVGILRQMDARLSDAQTRQFARTLSGDPAFGDLEAETLAWLARRADDHVRADVIDALANRVEPRAQQILADMLSRSGMGAITEAFADPRPGMRAGAARAARAVVIRDSGGDPKVARSTPSFAPLAPGLEVLSLDDEEPQVAIQALLARAWIGYEDAGTDMERIYKSNNLGVRLAVTEALGEMPGDLGHGMLTLILADERGVGNERLRAAALRGLASSRHPNAVRHLGFYLLNDRDEDVQRAAADALVELGTPDARFVLVDPLVQDRLRGPVKSRVVATLSRFRGGIVRNLLERHLTDKDLDVAAEAAIGAAEHDMPSSVPTLLTVLRRGTPEQRARAQRALETVTLKRFEDSGYTILAERYETWYERNRAKGWRRWLWDAMKDRGYNVSDMGRYVEGEDDVAVVARLVPVLRDEDGILRRAAAQALRRVTRQEFGTVDRSTPPGVVETIARRWSDWWEQEGRAIAEADAR